MDIKLINIEIYPSENRFDIGVTEIDDAMGHALEWIIRFKSKKGYDGASCIILKGSNKGNWAGGDPSREVFEFASEYAARIMDSWDQITNLRKKTNTGTLQNLLLKTRLKHPTTPNRQ